VDVSFNRLTGGMDGVVFSPLSDCTRDSVPQSTDSVVLVGPRRLSLTRTAKELSKKIENHSTMVRLYFHVLQRPLRASDASRDARRLDSLTHVWAIEEVVALL
jgi:hypothetical protein